MVQLGSLLRLHLNTNFDYIWLHFELLHLSTNTEETLLSEDIYIYAISYNYSSNKRYVFLQFSEL